MMQRAAMQEQNQLCSGTGESAGRALICTTELELQWRIHCSSDGPVVVTCHFPLLLLTTVVKDLRGQRLTSGEVSY